MRAIKFNAWHEVQKRMYSAEEMSRDQMAILPDGRFCNVHGGDPNKSTFPKLIPLQFTGLHDKNGREIYEGDILRFEHMIAYTGKAECRSVSFRDGQFVAMQGFGSADFKHGEVIGNIYENPELVNF